MTPCGTSFSCPCGRKGRRDRYLYNPSVFAFCKEETMLVLGLDGALLAARQRVLRPAGSWGRRLSTRCAFPGPRPGPGRGRLPGIRAAFGPGVFHPDGTLDRRALGAAIFGDAEKRARLDALMQPMILRRIGRNWSGWNRPGRRLPCWTCPALRGGAGEAVPAGLVRHPAPGNPAGPAHGAGPLHPGGGGKPPAQPDGPAEKGPPGRRGH